MQKLRRLVHYGRRSEAATLLEETLRTNPSHSRAREELSRYLTNRPFTFEEAEHEELKKILTRLFFIQKTVWIIQHITRLFRI